MAANNLEKTTNRTVAENLKFFMEEKGMNQPALAAASGVAQTTISLYLDPSRRLPSKSGKEPSAKVTELAYLAQALGIGVWELMRPAMSRKEREFYAQIEAAFKGLKP